MHCRSYLLIERELATFDKSPSKDIQAIPTFEGNLFHWTVRVTGPENSAWEGGVFKLVLLFNEYFNFYPPAVVFITIPFHPNIDPITGRLSMDLLDDPGAWTPDTSILSLLEAVRGLLATPSRSFVVNSEAEDLARQDPLVYHQLVTECVAVSRRLDEPLVTRSASTEAAHQLPLIEYDEAFVEAMHARETAQKPRHHTAQVSFEDYFATWSGIATSKTSPQQKNSHLTVIEGQAALLTIHHGVKFEEIEDHLTRQLEQHKSYMYGNFAKKSNQAVEIRDAKLERIEQMRKIYLSQKTPSNLTRKERTHDSIINTPQPADFRASVVGGSETRPFEAALPEHTTPTAGQAPNSAAVPAAATDSTPGASAAAAKPPSPGASAAKPPSPGASTAKPQSPGASAAKPPSPGASTAKPQSPGASAAKPQSPGASAAKPQSPGASAAKPPSPGASAAKPQLPEASAAKPPSPGTSAAKPQSPGASAAKPQSPGTSAANPPSPGASAVKPPSPGASAAKPPSPGAAAAKPPSPGASTAVADAASDAQSLLPTSVPPAEVAESHSKVPVNDDAVPRDVAMVYLNLEPSSAPGLMREATEIPPDDEVDALAAWSQNLGEE